MRVQSLTIQHQRLKRLIEEVKDIHPLQFELRAHWAKYLCVLSAGFLENAIKEVYSNYARASSNNNVAKFVESKLNNIQNPKSSRFTETAGHFNKEWQQSLEEFLTLDGNGSAIDAIVSNRHLIAHGKNSDITLARIVEYLEKSIKVIDFIEDQCKNRT